MAASRRALARQLQDPAYRPTRPPPASDLRRSVRQDRRVQLRYRFHSILIATGLAEQPKPRGRRSTNLTASSHAQLDASAHDHAWAECHYACMTQSPLRRRTGRSTWLAVGVIAFALGISALVASASLLTLEGGGWPWMTTTSEQANPPSATATIVEENGTVHRFTGTPSDTRAWLVSTEDELKKAHGIYTKITLGWVLRWAGVALLTAGTAVLLWRAIAAFNKVRSAKRR
jgi:hypothetical protein